MLLTTDTLLDVELKTLGKTLGDKMIQLPYHAVADTVAEVEDEMVVDDTGPCETRGTTSCSG